MGRHLAKMVRKPPGLSRDRHHFYVTIGRRTYCLEPHMFGAAVQEAAQLYAEFQAENGAQVVKLSERGPMFLREP